MTEAAGEKTLIYTIRPGVVAKYSNQPALAAGFLKRLSPGGRPAFMIQINITTRAIRLNQAASKYMIQVNGDEYRKDLQSKHDHLGRRY